VDFRRTRSLCERTYERFLQLLRDIEVCEWNFRFDDEQCGDIVTTITEDYWRM